MSQKVALLVIDPQVDFHDVPGAALPVPGSSKDTERLSKLIGKMPIDTIFVSQDSHYSLDISHKAWWEKADGSLVDPFTMIYAQDIKDGKYIPRIDPKRSLGYVESLEANGEFNHFIWPDHCLMGSPGHALMPEFLEALNAWMIKKLKWVNFIVKGVNPFTEHFGIFRANVPVLDDPTTNVNQSIFTTLNNHDIIYLGGQARTHCDANSLRQLLIIAPQLASKLVILEDGMSDVAGMPPDFYDMVDGIYQDAYSKGVRKCKTTDL